MSKAVFIFLGLLLAGLLLVIIPYDLALTRWLASNNIGWLSDFMGQTIFEGDPLGGGDVMIIYITTSLVLYIYTNIRKGKTRLFRYRHYLGFIILSSITGAIFTIHSLKWIMGRARPMEVFNEGMQYTHWFQFGAHYISEGIYRGSFPSGHTATSFLMMTLAYILFSHRQKGWGFKVAGLSVGGFTLTYAVTMAVSRCMNQRHWVSDSIFTLLSFWLVIHFMYYVFLKVPRQERFIVARRQQVSLPAFWEVKMAVTMFFLFYGIMNFFLGIRAFTEPVSGLYLLQIPVGLVLVYFSWRVLDRLYHQFRLNTI